MSRFPKRPAGMAVTLPDFTKYERRYVVTATVPTTRQPVTITATLTQHKEFFTEWEWRDDDLTGERGGHTLRRGSEAWHLLNTASAHLRRDAVAALRAAGWSNDDAVSGLWTAPLSIWSATLATVQNGGW